MRNPTITCLTELQERMESAVATLSELKDSAIDERNKMRLKGKMQGMEIALGYVHELIRQERRNYDWDRKFEEAAKAKF